MRTPLKTLMNFEKENIEALNSILVGIWGALNRGIEFGTVESGAENIRCDIKTFTAPATADIEFSISHTLSRTPKGYLIANKDSACNVYDGDTTNTDTELYLKCDTVSASGTVIII